METTEFNYHHGDIECIGYLAYQKSDQPRPTVLVVHDWTGCNAFVRQKAEMLAQMGYVGFALDMYGKGREGQTVEEKMALMRPLIEDRRLLRARIVAALEHVITDPIVDSERLAVMGFCFGGLCALDLARSGANIKGAVSFHGLLGKPEGLEAHPIKAKVLALHGYDDPMVPPEQLQAFCQEMTEKQVDWQVHQYGKTQHAFTNPNANDANMGTLYNPIAERRSLQAMRDFFNEIFA